MVVGLLGASGHMGIATLVELLKIDEIDKVKVLLLKRDIRNRIVRRLAKRNERISIQYGDISNIENLKELIDNCNYLLNLAALTPPKSDKNPHKSYLVNEVGPNNIVKLLENNSQIKLIDITSVALYGHRNEKHPFIRVGDPLLPSAFDVYSLHKLRGEYSILESNIHNFVIIRQTAMIYKEMLLANIDDGLMFHTPFNTPLEWSTAEDSGLLMANIIREDLKGKLNKDNFWNKVFNLGGTVDSRISGYETLECGFKLIGGTTNKFFGPNYNVERNFHGGFYYDGDVLEKMFHYQTTNFDDYWLKIKKNYPYFAFAKIVPSSLIKRFAITRLFKDSNSPYYWYKHNDIPRLIAFFGGKEKYEALPKKWENFKLWDYKNNRTNDKYKPIDYGFDINKSDKDITIDDLKNVAKMHGGKLMSTEFEQGDVYSKLVWENSDKVQFTARPYTILRGGHWYNPLYESNTWDFDRLAKKDKIYASFWYDSHNKDEKNCYYMDNDYIARIK